MAKMRMGRKEILQSSIQTMFVLAQCTTLIERRNRNMFIINGTECTYLSLISNRRFRNKRGIVNNICFL